MFFNYLLSCLELFFLSIITTTFFKHLYFNRDFRAVSLMTKCASNEILTFQEGQAETTPQYMFSFSHNPTPFSFPNKIIIFVGLWALIFIFFLFFFLHSSSHSNRKLRSMQVFLEISALFSSSLYSDQGGRKLHENE